MAISPGRRVFRPLTRCHRPWPGCRAPTNPPSRRARPSRSRIAVSPYAPVGRACPARSGCGRRPKGERATAVAPPPQRSDRPVVSCPARVGPTRPTNQVLDSSLGVVLAAGWHPTGLYGDLDATSMTSNGNQVGGLDPPHCRLAKLWTRRPAFPLVMAGDAWEDLNLRPHPYQLNAGNRCADRRSRRARSTVGARVMRSIRALVCVLLRLLEVIHELAS